MHFTGSVYGIYVHKVSWFTKSLRHLYILCIFIIQFCPLSCTVFQIATITPPLSLRWRCKWSHRVAYWNFTVPGHHFYEYCLNRSAVERSKNLLDQWVLRTSGYSLDILYTGAFYVWRYWSILSALKYYPCGDFPLCVCKIEYSGSSTDEVKSVS